MTRKLATAELLQSFQANGFAHIPCSVAGEEFDELLTHVDRFIRDVVPSMRAEEVFYEDQQDPASLKQLQRMGNHDDWFQQLFMTGRFRELAEDLLGGAVVPKNMQYFCKPPAIGRPTPPHQDGYYFMLEPCQAVTLWLALDPVDEENGCVRYVRGSHRRGMRQHARTQTLGFSQGIVDYPTAEDRRDEVAVFAKPGDLLVHHAMTIHRADANRSTTRHRRALGLVYFSQRAREDTALQAAYQNKLAAEMKAEGKI